MKFDRTENLFCFPGREIRLLAAILVFPAAVTVLTLAGSLFRWEISRLGAAAIITAGLLAALGYFRLLRGADWGEAPRRPERRFSRAIRGVILFAAVFYSLLWILAYAFPDLGFDGLWYHNPTMHFWSTRGYVHWIRCDVPGWEERINHSFNGWPKGVELLGFIALRAAGVPRLLNALNLPFLALGVFSVYCLARLWGAPVDFSLLAGSLFIFVPINIALSFTTLVDPAAAALYISLMALTAAAVKLIGEGKMPGKLLPGLGAALGLALGAKGPAIILPPLTGVLLLLAVVLARRRFGKYPAGKEVGFFILLTVLIAAAVGGYWSLRNLALAGSPVYPVGLQVAGRTIFPGAVLDSYLRKPFLPGTEEWSQWRRILFSWLDNLGQWRVAITRNDHPSGGLGLLWIFGGLPALIILLVSAGREMIFPRRGGEGRRRADPLLAVAALSLVLFFFLPSGHNHKARYVLWLYGPGLAAWAVVLGRARTDGSKSIRRLGAAWAVAGTAVIIFQGLYSFHYHFQRLSRYNRETAGESRLFSRIREAWAGYYPSGYLWREIPGTGLDYVFNDNRPVALGPLRVMAQPVLGHLTQDKNFGWRGVYFLSPSRADDPAGLAEFIRERAIRYVIWDEGMPIPPHLRELALLEESAGRYFRLLVVDPGRVLPGEPRQLDQER